MTDGKERMSGARLSPLVLAAAVGALLVAAAPHAWAAETYEVEHWPADLDTIPCSAWQKMSDGTWALNGSFKVGASVLSNVGFKGDTAARLIERKCGK